MTDPHASDLNHILAVRVRDYMWAGGLTQRQLADMAVLDERTVRRIVAGKGATVATLEKIATALHVQAFQLLQKAA